MLTYIDRPTRTFLSSIVHPLYLRRQAESLRKKRDAAEDIPSNRKYGTALPPAKT